MYDDLSQEVRDCVITVEYSDDSYTTINPETDIYPLCALKICSLALSLKPAWSQTATPAKQVGKVLVAREGLE